MFQKYCQKKERKKSLDRHENNHCHSSYFTAVLRAEEDTYLNPPDKLWQGRKEIEGQETGELDGNLGVFWRFPVSLFSRIRTTEPLFSREGSENRSITITYCHYLPVSEPAPFKE